MSLEVTLITSVLASAIGSKSIAEALVQLYREKFREKTTDNSQSSDAIVAEGSRLYLSSERESEIVNEAAIEALDETYQSTRIIADERMRQARLSFNVAIGLMIIGVLIVFFGIGLLYLKEGFESGLITIGGGAVSEIISVIVFSFNKETNNRLDELRKDLSTLETARVGLKIAKEIENQEKRDNAISELSLRIQNG